jgi:hypothetical protein
LKIINIYLFSWVCAGLDAKIITVKVLRAVLLEITVRPTEYLELGVALVDAGFAERFHTKMKLTFQLILAILGA